MAKNLAMLLLWFVLTPTLLSITLYLAFQQNKNPNILQDYPSVVTSEYQLDNDIKGQVLSTQVQDLRPYIVSKFLQDTPLEPYSLFIVETSDKFGIDYRLIPAIAMKESGAGATIDQSTHNAWGWENGQTIFSSWDFAIEVVAKTLKNNYINKGLTTPEEIMTVYAPPQIYTGGKWARDINFFFSQMESL